MGEWMDAYRRYSGPDPEQDVRNVFAQMDVDGSKEISLEELLAFFEQHGPPNATKEEIEGN